MEQVPITCTEEQREALLDLLTSHFRPAESAAEADHMYPTSQLFHIIVEHSPGLIPPEALRDALLKLGYKEHMVGDEFRWMLKSAA